ncbi:MULTISPECIES: amidohydrolase family protein [Mameliella]|uniref:amidohydrolase family protein n=1 Tax=Mameliella TaxID=1434019 RepID=UPI000B52F075|nr:MULTISPECIES: amidohydrolase family protein [Mameliella]MCR9272105.1 amidohydrolase family protein [Paracoccaceae bacterium]OWV62700.1 amidohydrolase [Mameliella alba]
MDHIDSHHHFWHPARDDYGWMPADDPVLSVPYHPADLAPGLQATGVTRTVLVQAAPTVAETEYLLGIADCTPHVAKVVGWIDFEDPDQRNTLQHLARHPKFAGVRPMIQDIPDDLWMLKPEVQWAFDALIEMDLTFDALGFPRHQAPFLELLNRYPDMRVVLDHCLKPQLRSHSDDSFHAWAEGMTRLAQETGAFCKLSGLVTEADELPSDDLLAPYVGHILSVFGPQRVMWGSDWPVARLRCNYADWHAQALRLTAGLSQADHAQVFSGTAKRFYRL